MQNSLLIPDELELSALPLRAQVSFAARCAKRVRALETIRPKILDEYRLMKWEHAVRKADAFAEGSFYALAMINSSAFMLSYSPPEPESSLNDQEIVDEVHEAVYGCCAAAGYYRKAPRSHDDIDSDYLGVLADKSQQLKMAAAWAARAGRACVRAAELSALAENPNGRDIAISAIRRDFESLHDVSVRDSWTHETHLPKRFFELHSVFDVERLFDNRSIISVASVIDSQLLAYFHKYPDRLFKLTPREFEEVIATLFDQLGFEVELTKRTRDGGRDIVAIGHRIVRTKYLIECKHYAPLRKVTVNPVRALHGVVADEGATKGILVTTSSFTRPATDYFKRNQWLLEGRDFDGLVEWLGNFQRFQMAEAWSHLV